MTRKTFKTAILGLLVLLPLMAILYTVFNALIMLACKSLLYMLQNPVSAILIVLGIMILGFIADHLYTRYKK